MKELKKKILYLHNIHTKNIPLHKDVNLIHLAKISSQYSGAEIASICREAALNSIEESEGDDDNIYVKQKHFLKALKNIQPKTTKDMLAFYENFLK